MSWSASIRVVDDEGDPVSDVKVTIIFSLMSGYDTKYTDSDGWAEFEYKSIDSGKSMSVKTIYVNGEEVGGGFRLENGDTKSFNLP